MNGAVTERIITLVDMDCFYCQVEARLNPELQGKPVAVVQYNQWKGGGIIAVNYEARDRGVTRYMRGDKAKEVCPEIILVSVPTIRGKADLSKYRDAGDEVAKIFSEFSECVQRASIDEAYLDLTKAVDNYIKTHSQELQPDLLSDTFVVGYCELKSKNEGERVKGLKNWLSITENQKMIENADYRLAVGGVIVEKMRKQIFEKTGFHCSAGIAHNKILAKLTSSLHKPKKQTILPQDSVPELYETLPVHKVRNLGGKLGKLVSEKLSVTYMSDLHKFSLQELQQNFDKKTSNWLYNIARGIDLEVVTSRLCPESIGCCKNFSGKNMLLKKSEVEHWLKELATEISQRLFKDLEKNKRRAKLLTVSFYQESAMTRCGSLNSYDINKIASDALGLLKKFNTAPSADDLWNPPIKYLGLSASKFVEESTSIERFLKTEVNGNQSETKIITSCNTKQMIINDEVLNCKKNKGLDSYKESPSSSNGQSKSFFFKFLDSKKFIDKLVKIEEKKDEKDSDSAWISLSEMFPDVTQAEPEIVELLPEPLQKKFKEQFNSNNKMPTVAEINNENEMKELANLELKENSAENDVETEICSEITNENEMKELANLELKENSAENDVETEICSECKKNIPVNDFLEHLDYHVAFKLHTEINNPANELPEGNKPKVKKPENHSKRKKGGIVTPSKKMKSITSFFTVLPK